MFGGFGTLALAARENWKKGENSRYFGVGGGETELPLMPCYEAETQITSINDCNARAKAPEGRMGHHFLRQLQLNSLICPQSWGQPNRAQLCCGHWIWRLCFFGLWGSKLTASMSWQRLHRAMSQTFMASKPTASTTSLYTSNIHKALSLMQHKLCFAW